MHLFFCYGLSINCGDVKPYYKVLTSRATRVSDLMFFKYQTTFAGQNEYKNKKNRTKQKYTKKTNLTYDKDIYMSMILISQGNLTLLSFLQRTLGNVNRDGAMKRKENVVFPVMDVLLGQVFSNLLLFFPTFSP